MPILSNFTSFFSRKADTKPALPEETPTAPSAPALEAEEAVVVLAAQEGQKGNFESLLGRLYRHEEGHSAVRTWTVRVLSTLFVFPVVLTALLDLARILAFSAGLINGKSWSLIDKTSDTCKALADKVQSVYKSTSQEKTVEQLNEESKLQLKKHAQKLVDAYRSLNGGYFHTNGSFSAPFALNAEKQIAKEQAELIRLMKDYVVRNATSTEDFETHLAAAEKLVEEAIKTAAKDDVYVENKVERKGPRRSLAEVVDEEFLEISDYTFAKEFIDLARHEPNVAAGLDFGVKKYIITKKQAKDALAQHVQAAYVRGLEEGLDEASRVAGKIVEEAKQHNLITDEESEKIASSVSADVNALAKAAARDVARNQTEETSDTEVTQQLSKAADNLKEVGRLKAEDETQFLTEAKAQLEAAKQAVEAERAARQAAEEVEEAQRAIEVQRAQTQAGLLNTFIDYLNMVGQKQEDLLNLHKDRNQLEALRQETENQVAQLSRQTVEINGRQRNIMEAAREYQRAVIAISSSKTLGDEEKRQRLQDLVNQGFDQLTIAKINEFNALVPRLQAVIDQMATLSEKIKVKHPELLDLIAVYKVFKANNLKQLEQPTRKVVSETEKRVFLVQDNLNERYNHLLLRGIVQRIKGQPVPVVNQDPEANRAEVARLLKEYAEAQIEALPELPEEGETLPELPSAARRYVTKAVNAALDLVNWPVNAIASRWNQPSVQSELVSQEA